MTDMTYQQMISARQDFAKSKNQGRWSITSPGNKRNEEYAKGADKDGLDKEKRARIESIKDSQTYHEEVDLF